MIYLDEDDKMQGQPAPPVIPETRTGPRLPGDRRGSLSSRLRACASEVARHGAQMAADGHEALAVRLLGAASTIEQVAAEPCAAVEIAGATGAQRGPTPRLYDIRHASASP